VQPELGTIIRQHDEPARTRRLRTDIGREPSIIVAFVAEAQVVAAV